MKSGRELLNTVTVAEALRLLEEHYQPGPLESVTVRLAEALGRTVAVEVISPETLPPGDRSTVDGYAVRARDVFGASESTPAYLGLAGTVAMGEVPEEALRPGATWSIATGGFLPQGADACVMVEETEGLPDGTVEVRRPVAPGENVACAGEDVAAGEVALPAGIVLGPQHLGFLAALGVTSVEVFREPRVALISTGDEIVPAECVPKLGQMRDVNSVALAAAVRQAGGEPLTIGLVPDDLEVLLRATRHALYASDLVVISGGSSKGTRDFVLDAIDACGEPGVFVHGIAMRPGKPVIIGVAGGKPLFGLPGHPVSALVTFGLFVARAMRRLLGRRDTAEATVRARLTANVTSAPGREDSVRVKLARSADGWIATPILGKSGLISVMARSEGTVRVSSDIEGLLAGETVEVYLG